LHNCKSVRPIPVVWEVAMHFRGRLLKDGQVVLNSIDGTITGPTDAAGWRGSFALPPEQFLPAGRYVLDVAGDGSATIRLGSVASSRSRPAVVHFTGCGMLE
jgi:hypothetical protein